MRRTATRFLLVLSFGAGILYFVSRHDQPIRGKESPSVITGPLGDVGAPLPRSGSRRVRVTPVRKVVIRQLAKLKKTEAEEGTEFFQPIAQLHGSSVEYRADQIQVIRDALFVRELDGTSIASAALRRSVLQKILAYDPSARPRSKTAKVDPQRKLTHVRVAAQHAEMEGLSGVAPRIRFYGGPPDGVQITAFDERGEPVLEFRTAFLVVEQKDRGEDVELAVSSPKRVHFFSPDDRYRLSGTGMRGHFLRPRDRRKERAPAVTPTESLGVFVLESEILFEAPEGISDFRPSREKNDGATERTGRKDDASTRRTRWKHRGTLTCAGPARLRVRRVEQPRREGASAKREADVFVDSLELLGRVHGHHESTGYEGDFVASHSIQELDADRVRVWITNGEIRSAIATGDVVASLTRRTPAGDPNAPQLDPADTEVLTTTLRCQRARLAFEDRVPQWVRAYAWSAQPVKFGIGLRGAWWGAVPLFQPPEVVGRFQLKGFDEGRFRAKCRREIVLERKPRKDTGRITLLDHVEIDFRGAGRTDKPASGSDEEAPSWLPGFSGLTARDKVVVDHFGRPKRLLDFAAEGDVRFETVLGKMRADRLSGTVVDENEWRVEADGYPVLDLPITSRSSGKFESVLRALTLERAGAPRASETTGRIRVEGARAVFEMKRSPDTNRSKGAARFSEAVKVTQQEASSVPIRLFCRDLRFRFDQPSKGKTAATSEVVADGDVIIDAGDNVRASGDRLVFDQRGDDARGGVMTGYPARLKIVDRREREVVLEGQTIEIDRNARRAVARTGAFARYYPSRETSFRIPGAETRSASIAVVDLHADTTEIEWREGRALSAFRAYEAVRVRGYARAGDGDGETPGPLVQWADAEELHYELTPEKGGKDRVTRTLRLVGERDNPVRIGYRDPLGHSGDDDYRLDVPVLEITSDGDQRRPERVTGYGPGRIRLRSQDNVFGSETSGGTRRDQVIELRFRNGFAMRTIDKNRARLDFPDGGELTSRKRDGTLMARIVASKTLALRLNTAKRKNDSDLRVVDSGLAEGDVQVWIRNDTTGGADAVTWDRGTNTVIMTGNPAWLEKPEGASTGRRITYNLSTRRVRVTDFAGRLRRKFERKERKP